MLRDLGSVLPALALTTALAAQTPVAGDRWPAYRGGGDSGGTTTATDLPLEWSAETNVAWSADLVGYGQSSPVVFGDRVFVTSVHGTNKELAIVSCYRTTDGLPLWTRSYAAGVEIPSSKMVSRGAPTPAVDERGVYAFFESGDFIAIDHAGETRWHRSLCREYGRFEGNHGVGSSVLLLADAVAVLLDHAGPSYLLALDKRTGENVWKLDRTPRVSWSTPVVAATATGTEIVVSSNGSVEGIDAARGQRRWHVDGLDGNTVPSPFVAGENVVVAASKGTSNLLVRRPTADGDAAAQIVWRADARPCGFASPLVFGDQVFYLNKAGSLTSVGLADGKARWRERLAEACWASPISDGTHVWYFGKQGTTTVLAPTVDGANVVATNALPTEETVYGVAAVDGAFFVREGTRLLRLGRPTPATPADGETRDAAAEPRRRG